MRSLAIVTCLVACAGGPPPIQRTETRVARAGRPAALYDMRDFGVRLGQVILWSEGVHPTADRDGAVVHLGAQIRNEAETPLSLDGEALALEVYDREGFPLPPPQFATIRPPDSGSAAIPPGSARDYDFFFIVKPDRSRGEIGSLRLTWALVHADGRRYAQATDFTRDEQTEGAAGAYIPVWGFYDPFLVPLHTRAVAHHVAVGQTVVPRRAREP
jgi:hypothetical protein